MTAEQEKPKLKNLRKSVHPNCVVCSRTNKSGLKLEYRFEPSKQCVFAEFSIDNTFQGYPGMLHGGVISAIFDGAMVNWLFANDCPALTAQLTVKFRHSMKTCQKAKVKAWLQKKYHPLYTLKAEITQKGIKKAYATGKFLHNHTMDFAKKPKFITI